MAMVASVVAVGCGPTPATPRATDGPDGSPAAVPAASGPLVFYELLTADASVLMARRLDGASPPRVVGRRPEAEDGRTWGVDPNGSIAIAALPTDTGQHLVAIRTDDGTDLWQLDLPPAPIDEAVWSADGRRIAWIGHPGDSGATETFVIDTRNGHLVRTAVPDGAAIQAFDADDVLVLREHPEGVQPPAAQWQFSRIDPATNAVQQLPAAPAVGPSGIGFDDTDPALGIGVTTDVGPNDHGTAILAWPLAGGPSRTLAVLPSLDHLAIDPAGRGLAYSADQTVRYVAWDGGSSELWSGDDGVADIEWSDDGSFLGVTGDTPGANLWLVERATGRRVALPIGERVAQSLIVRIVGGTPLPPAALPAAEPTPTPTPPPAGPDIAAAPALAAAWFDTSGTVAKLHVERLVPTQDGGLRVAAVMPPIDVGPVAEPDQIDRSVELLPRPGTDQLLLWVQVDDRSTGWLWDGTPAAPGRLPLPKDWPSLVADVAWRPDGAAVAGDTDRERADGNTDRQVVVAALGATRTTVIPARRGYDRVTGWWSATELRLAHAACETACDGRFAWFARLRVRDAALVPFTVRDRTAGVVDQVLPDGRGGLALTAINNDPRTDVSIDWPIPSASPDGPDVLGFASDHRSLIVGNRTATGTDVYRIDDPAGRAVNGRLPDPAPTLIGHVEGRFLELHASPDAGWTLSVDRVGAWTLTQLAGGRRWAIEPGRTLEWWP
jgi:hypothetical protein